MSQKPTVLLIKNRKPPEKNLIRCHYDSLGVAFSYKVPFTPFGFAQLNYTSQGKFCGSFFPTK